MTGQQKVIVQSIKKYGALDRQVFIDFCIDRGQIMDPGFAQARVTDINNHPEKFDLPKGTKIGRILVRNSDHKINHIYMFVDKEEWVKPKATDCTKYLVDVSPKRKDHPRSPTGG